MTLWNVELFSVTDVNNAEYILNQSNCRKIKMAPERTLNNSNGE